MLGKRCAVALLALAGCGDNLPSPYTDPRMVEVARLPAQPSHELDLLFQIDDSPGTAHFHLSLRRALGALLGPLSALEGGLPDLHVGVITSDLGTEGSLDPANPAAPIGQVGNGGCAGHGDDGRFLPPPTATNDFLIDEADGLGGRSRNFDGDLATELGITIQRAGAGGCGFEQPLAATRRALTNPLNAGFRRSAANLLVVVVADEDDCSIRDPAILGTSADLGPLQSFRCTAHGVECDQEINTTGPKTGCRPRADSAYIDDLAPFGDFFFEISSPAKLVVAGIVAPDDVAIELRAPPGGGEGQFALAHSCSWITDFGLVVADPAVRLAAFVGAFESHGVLTSICSDDLSAQVAQIAQVTKQMFGIACLHSETLKDSNTEPGIQPACEVTEIDGDVETKIPACPLADDCFEIVEDPAACPDTADHLRLRVQRTVPAQPGAYVRARCEVP